MWDDVRATYDPLAARHDVIMLEGAGSPAEINLKSGDLHGGCHHLVRLALHTPMVIVEGG